MGRTPKSWILLVETAGRTRLVTASQDYKGTASAKTVTQGWKLVRVSVEVTVHSPESSARLPLEFAEQSLPYLLPDASCSVQAGSCPSRVQQAHVHYWFPRERDKEQNITLSSNPVVGNVLCRRSRPQLGLILFMCANALAQRKKGAGA